MADFGIASGDGSNEIFGTTPKGNSITDKGYKMMLDRVEGSSSVDGVRSRMLPLLKKAKKEDVADDFAEAISEYLKSRERYDPTEVWEIVNNVANG